MWLYQKCLISLHALKSFGIPCISFIEWFHLIMYSAKHKHCIFTTKLYFDCINNTGLWLHVTGGVHNGEYVSWLYCYDPVMDVWARKQDMNTKRAIHVLAGMNDRLYAIGGNHLKGERSGFSGNDEGSRHKSFGYYVQVLAFITLWTLILPLRMQNLKQNWWYKEIFESADRK